MEVMWVTNYFKIGFLTSSIEEIHIHTGYYECGLEFYCWGGHRSLGETYYYYFDKQIFCETNF